MKVIVQTMRLQFFYILCATYGNDNGGGGGGGGGGGWEQKNWLSQPFCFQVQMPRIFYESVSCSK
jgi:hypothetical protein